MTVQGIKAVWEGNEAKAALTGRKGKSKGTESQRTGYQKGDLVTEHLGVHFWGSQYSSGRLPWLRSSLTTLLKLSQAAQ